MAELRQTSFAAGELSPGLWGRSDLEAYQHGLRACRNFLVGKLGELRTRPATSFMREAPEGTTKARMVGVQVSDSEAYLVLITNAGILVSATQSTSTTFLQSPYAAEDIDRLTFAHSGRSLIIFSENTRPRRLFIRNALNASLTIYLPAGIPEAPELNIGIEERGVTDDTLKTWAYAAVLSDDETGELVGTQLRRIGRFFTEELKPGDPVPDKLRVDQGHPVAIGAYGKQPSPPAGYSIEVINIYRAIGQASERPTLGPGVGWVARISAADTRFNSDGRVAPTTDIGVAPDEFRLPRAWDNPLQTIFVRTGVFYEGRLLVANGARTNASLPDLPEQIWCSEVGFYRHFDQHTMRRPDSAFSFKLGGPQAEEIRHLVGAGQLLLFTDTAVHAIDEALSADSIPHVRRQIGFGSSWVRPLLLSSEVLFCKAGGGVWRLRYSWEARSYIADELSLTFGMPAVGAWAFSQNPLSVLWSASPMSPVGAPFYSMTYTPEFGFPGWARHSTGVHVRNDGNTYQDQVVDICSLRDGGRDRTFVLVRRFIGTGFKLLLEEIGGGLYSNDLLLDCSTFSGTIEVPPDRKISIPFSHLSGREISVALRSIDDPSFTVLGPFPIQSGKVEVEVPERMGRFVACVAGIPYEAEIELLDVPTDKLKSKTVKRVGLEVRGARGFWVGESREAMTEGLVRHVTDGFGPPAPGEGVIDVLITSSWNKHGRVVLQQREPFALTVLGVTREVIGGG